MMSSYTNVIDLYTNTHICVCLCVCVWVDVSASICVWKTEGNMPKYLQWDPLWLLFFIFIFISSFQISYHEILGQKQTTKHRDDAIISTCFFSNPSIYTLLHSFIKHILSSFSSHRAGLGNVGGMVKKTRRDLSFRNF